MSHQARSVSEAVERLGRRDPTLEWIYLDNKHLHNKQVTDAELCELADCLLAHPDVVMRLWLGGNQLADETGVKLARYLAASSTIHWLLFSYDQLGAATYLAVAAALRVNSSLQYLNLYCNQAVDRTRIDAAFIEALRLNPDRSAESMWCLHFASDDFPRLSVAADALGHPSLQLLLAVL